MRYSARVLLSVVVTVSILHLLWYCTFGVHTESPVSVIVLKLPRSGSSWFTELLNNDPSTYISKEIIQSGDKIKFSQDEKEQHLTKALVVPTDKLSNSMNILPSGRFVEDYVLHKTWKWLTAVRAVGFTLNTEHTADVNWNVVVKRSAQPHTKMIIFGRSNMVKTAISASRGEELKRVCGLANIKQGRSDCVLPPQHSVSLAALLNRTIYWQDRYDAFYRSIGHDETLRHLQYLQVVYEELQADTTGTMQKVHDFLSGGSPAPRTVRSNAKVWVKRSPDDLSLLLTDFAAMNAQLSHRSCATFKKQLNDVNHTIFGNGGSLHDQTATDFRKCLASLS